MTALRLNDQTRWKTAQFVKLTVVFVISLSCENSSCKSGEKSSRSAGCAKGNNDPLTVQMTIKGINLVCHWFVVIATQCIQKLQPHFFIVTAI